MSCSWLDLLGSIAGLAVVRLISSGRCLVRLEGEVVVILDIVELRDLSLAVIVVKVLEAVLGELSGCPFLLVV